VPEEVTMSFGIGELLLHDKNNNSYERAKLKYQ
jgi:hypothetical protein